MSAIFDGPLARVVGAVMARMNRDAEAEAVELLSPAPGQRVLAIGFGPGVGVRILAERLVDGQAVGVDPSAAMLKAASRANRSAVAGGKVVLHLATADAVPEPDASFDGALAVNAIQLCQPLEPAAAELARVMKPGGKLIALTHDWALARRSGSVEAWLAEARRAFDASGFEDVQGFRGRAEKGKIVAFTARRRA